MFRCIKNKLWHWEKEESVERYQQVVNLQHGVPPNLQLYPWVSRFSPQSSDQPRVVSAVPLHPGWRRWCPRYDPCFDLVHVHRGFARSELLPCPLCWKTGGRERPDNSLILKILLHFWEKPLHLQTISVDCPCKGSIIHSYLVDFWFIIVKLCCFLPSGLHKSPCHVPTLLIHDLTAKSKCNQITLEQWLGQGLYFHKVSLPMRFCFCFQVIWCLSEFGLITPPSSGLPVDWIHRFAEELKQVLI